ncbi:MAG TPA: hypothetical protein VGP43_02545 [Chitinophagaceae bacterium]|nr:hypothetical protein [Chitinophagaceae bacterium]
MSASNSYKIGETVIINSPLKQTKVVIVASINGPKKDIIDSL